MHSKNGRLLSGLNHWALASVPQRHGLNLLASSSKCASTLEYLCINLMTRLPGHSLNACASGGSSSKPLSFGLSLCAPTSRFYFPSHSLSASSTGITPLGFTPRALASEPHPLGLILRFSPSGPQPQPRGLSLRLRA